MTKPSPRCSPRKTSEPTEPKRVTYAARIRAAYQHDLVFDRFYVERKRVKQDG